MVGTDLDVGNLKKEIVASLKSYSSVGLEEVAKVRLMDRVDRKYVLPIILLPEIFNKSEPYYFVQEILGNRMAGYSTLYYDTHDFYFYHSHVNGQLNRTKVRTRRYDDSNRQFLEAKLKSNRGRTTKVRIERSDFEGLDGASYPFLQEHISPVSSYDLVPVLTNNFKRITLVSKSFDERITIDVDLSFKTIDKKKTLKAPALCIIEVKQNKRAYSPLGLVLRDLRIKQTGISKYCLGVSQLFSEVKKNRYKQKVRSFEKKIGDKIIVEKVF